MGQWLKNGNIYEQETRMSYQDDRDRGGSSPDRSPNDDRSDVMNPNSDAYQADQANQANQANSQDDDD